jgi:molecular chaperone DnaK
VPKIEVTFDIDADGIVHCGARDYGSGIKAQITIQRSAGLLPEEVEAFQQEAKEFAEQDRQVREQVSATVKAQALVAEAMRTVQKYGDRVEIVYVDKVTRACEVVEEALSKGLSDEIKSTSAGLDVALMELGSAIHSGNRGGASNRPGGTSEKKRAPLPDDDGPIELSGPIELGGPSEPDNGPLPAPPRPPRPPKSE